MYKDVHSVCNKQKSKLNIQKSHGMSHIRFVSDIFLIESKKAFQPILRTCIQNTL